MCCPYAPQTYTRAVFAEMIQIIPDDDDIVPPCHLHSLLQRMPHALHSAILSRQVSIYGKLDLLLSPSDPLPLAAMHSSRLHLTAPGLLTLRVCTLGAASGVPSVAMFANAIASHTSLTHLRLSRLKLQDHGALELFPQLAQMSQLCCLHILQDLFFGPVLSACAEAVRDLPELTECSISEIHVPHSETGAISTARASCQSLMRALESAAKLQELLLEASILPCSPSVILGGFLQLQQLKLLVFDCKNPCHECLPAFSHVRGWILMGGFSCPTEEG